MPITASDNDKAVADIGRRIGTLIELKQQQSGSVNSPSTADFEGQISKRIEALNINQQTNFHSPYFRFFYQQLLKAKSHGLLSDVLPAHRNPAPAEFECIAGEDKSKFAPERIIELQSALSCSSKTVYLYSLNPADYGEKFVAWLKENQKGHAPVTAEDDAGKKALAEAVIDFYHGANKAIGGDTQKSNLSGHACSAGLYLSNTATGLVYGQKQDSYHKFEEAKHAYWQALFLQAQQAIEQGEDLSDEHLLALSIDHNGRPLGRDETPNPYYALADHCAESDEPQLVHVGHATAELRMGSFTLFADPVQYQSGTDGIIGALASIFYPRETAPAFPTTRYPGGQIVWISHNHHDHLCPKTLKESFPADTIFVVPKGDKATLEAWGFTNVHELENWNSEITIRKKAPAGADDTEQAAETLTIRALPARHASNRRIDDYMQSLYQGCILTHNDGKGKTTRHLITGDTGTYNQGHLDDLHQWVQQNGPIDSASLAAGPDRPREFMECTHQSTADALVLGARLSLANWDAHLKRRTDAPTGVVEAFNDDAPQQPSGARTQKDFINTACNGIAYHQGCFRLGLLSYADVACTIGRMTAFLDNLDPRLSVDRLLQQLQAGNVHQNAFYWVVMDQFERYGIIQLMEVLSKVRLDTDQKLTVGQSVEFIQHRFNVPKIGTTATLKQDGQKKQFHLDYGQLIVNKPAELRLRQLYAELVEKQPQNLHQQLEQYLMVFEARTFSSSKVDKFRAKLADDAFKARAEVISLSGERDPTQLQEIHKLLGELTVAVQGEQTHDNDLREEGNFQTLALMLAEEHSRACKLLLAQQSRAAVQAGDGVENTRTIESAKPVVDVKRLTDNLRLLAERYATIHPDDRSGHVAHPRRYRPTKYAAVKVALDWIEQYGAEDERSRLALAEMARVVKQRDLRWDSPEDYGLHKGETGLNNILHLSKKLECTTEEKQKSELSFVKTTVDQLQGFARGVVRTLSM